MDTLKYICDKYNIDLVQLSPFYLPIGRHKDIPKLFHELGFKVGAEIGVFEGAYSHRLLHYCSGLKLYGVDIWEIYSGYRDYQPRHMASAYQKAQDNVKEYDCTLIKGWSTEVAKQFKDESLDFVFLDGNHAYEYVVADIAAWSKKVRKGGIIYGHDFDDYSNHKRWKEMNVIPAVEGWMKSYKIHPWFVTTNNANKCWMYVK